MRAAAVVFLLPLAALFAGVALTVQPGVNAELSRFVGDPFRAAFISFAVGTIALALAAAVLVLKPLPSASRLADAPWWAWVGGLLGTVYVVVSIVVAPRLGAAVFIAVVIAGQTVAALVVDQYGWLGFKEAPITPGRAAGALLLIAGVVLVRLF